MNPTPVALTIAGSDPSGGAGLQADLKTFQAFGVYGASVVSVLTDCNTLGVTDVHVPPWRFLARQLRRVCSDLPVAAVKSGMLFSRDAMRLTAACLAAEQAPPYVLDPVVTTRRGEVLVDSDALALLRQRLLPLCDLVTPSMPEAAVLTDQPVESRADIERVGARLCELGAENVLITGGHLPGAQSPDYFVGRNHAPEWLEGIRIPSHFHGAGDCLSAAVTAALAQGHSIPAAVRIAKEFLNQSADNAEPVGQGELPMAHGRLARCYELSRGR